LFQFFAGDNHTKQITRVPITCGKASCMFPLYTLERDGRIWNVPLQPCFRIQVA